MVRLEHLDRLTLLRILEGAGELATERGRRQTLINAGLGNIASHLDLSGSPTVALGEVIERLCNYGRLTPDAEALGVLLNWIKSSVGEEQQREIATLMMKYHMMVPLALLPSIPDWRSPAKNADVLERIIGENTLRDIAFLEEGQRVARSVAYIDASNGSGTGFMVSPSMLLTNAHVLPDQPSAMGAVFRFNYQNDWSGQPRPTSEFRPREDGLFFADDRLDFALVELEGRPGEEWGWLPLDARAKVKKGDRVSIIQHAGGQAKKVSFQNNFVLYLETPLVQYVTSTLPGSSGSPVFDNRWRVVALHHAGGMLLEPSTGQHHFRNEGILVSAILSELSGSLRQRLTP